MRLSTAVSQISNRLLERRFLLALTLLYVLVWLWSAWSPVYRFDWALENMLPTVMVIALVLSFRKLPLSDISYLLLFLFLTLHQIGAHYTYSEVPFGWWLKDVFGLERNHFDRIVHFSFGFLLFYPMREVIIRFVTPSSFHAGLYGLSLNTAGSAIFEIIEMGVALVVNPEAGTAYLGMQGDVWDAQKDMALALLGSIIAFGLTELAVRTGLLADYLVPRHQTFRTPDYT
jgi:putative membrane protein